MVQFPSPSLIEELPAVSDPLPQCISHEATDAYFAAIAGPIVSLPVVSGLCRGGATENVRAFFWKLLLGFLPTETSRWAPLLERKALEYREIVSIVCCLDEKGDVVVGDRSYRAVDLDIPRTMPSMHFFKSGEPSPPDNGVYATFSPTQQSLRRIIHTLAGVNKGLGYVQGMNELVGHLLYAFASGRSEVVNEQVESEVFFCFQTMLAYLGDDFCRSLDYDQDTGVSCTIRNFERLLQFLEPELWEHLGKKQIKSEFYAFRWLTLLFTQEFNVPDVFRVWDFLFSFGEELRSVVLVVAVAMLNCLRDELLRLTSLSEILPLLQSYPPCDVNDFLKVAMGWIDRYGFRLVKELKVATSEDVLRLQRRFCIPVPGDASWSSSFRGLMSSVKEFAKHIR
ncbi:GTPase activating protein of Rab-like GTPase, putative [Trypanosoma cruzi]|nr:GTPase activating protein of Rab-like GTPase, putative [Trypanosoma cruzi]